jgi:two-component system response regulator AtoC
MKILIVDDEQDIRDSIKRYLKLEGIAADCAENGLSGQRCLQEQTYAAAIVDLRMPGMSGLELIRWIRGEGLNIPVIMISAYGEIDDAVEAMKSGAQDYIVKPFNAEELLLRLRKMIEAQSLRDCVERGKRQADLENNLIGESPCMRKAKELIAQIAPAPSTVLVTGENGCGKEVVARCIHEQSLVSAGPFVPVNVGGLPESLVESELFGYERGAFTGAASRKIGLFELARGGTLFLDEIGEMAPSLQVKLLRVLQDKRIRRLGGTTDIPIDARLIAATNADLELAVREGRFRQDLFYRLNVLKIAVPPLRERPEDVPLLFGHFIEKLNRKLAKTIEGMSRQALERLQSQPFPGNVRELENMIERAFIFAGSSILEESDFEIRGGPAKSPRPRPASTMKSIEKRSIIEALRRWEGNRTRAAKELGIARRTIINKIRQYGIDSELSGGD